MIYDSFQLAKGIFNELRCYGYELYCIVGFSLCIYKEQKCKRLCFGSIIKLYRRLIKVSFSM